jgi:hypothetical protein
MEGNQMKSLAISFGVSYFFAAFINWHYDPSEWSEFARFGLILFGFVVFGMVNASKKNN